MNVRDIIAGAGGITWSTRVMKTCAECGQQFSTHPIVIPHCIPCERRHPTTIEQGRMLLDGLSWAEVNLRSGRRPLEHDTAGRISAPQALLNQRPTPIDAVADWCAKPQRPLTITGLVGRGKTWQAVGAMRAITSSHATGEARMVNCVSLHRSLEAFELRAIRECLLLVLDDFGARLSPGAVATAYELIEMRTGDGRPLIVTTNLSRSDIAAMDERIESRLSGGTWLQMDGVDRRIA